MALELARIVVVLSFFAPSACGAQPQRVPGQQVAVVQGVGAQGATVLAAPGQELTLSAGLESAYVLQGSPGEAYLVIDLAAAQAQAQAQRPSMGVALVIDRSGSMAGDKIVNARNAASSFIQSMADGDVVSVYQYDDVVEQVAPPTVVDANSRALLASVVQGIQPRGSTNLNGGLVAGIESLSSALAERPVRRVILISDGLANVGPSSPFELGNTAATGAARGVSVTTIGVGLDYDENLMTTVAVRSGGRFYHLQEPAQLAAILETELNSLGATVARAIQLELVPAPGVQVLGASGADLVQQGQLVQLNVGEMLGSSTRQVVVPVRVPTIGPSAGQIGALTLRYRSTAGNAERTQQGRVGYQLAASQTQVDQSVRPQFAVAVESYRTVQAQRQAAELVAQGNTTQAAQVLQDRSANMRARAHAMGGEAERTLAFDADEVAGQGQAVQAAPAAPAARRALELDLEDQAAEAEGY
jgi:Ca-activated chloride channel homolog